MYRLLINKKVNKLDLITCNILFKIKCVFNRSYIDETDIYRIATEKTNLRNNRIISVENREGRKIYIYENSIDIEYFIDINLFVSLDDFQKNIEKRMKVYDFMKEHKIILKYASLVLLSDRNMYNYFICNIFLNSEDIKVRSSGVLQEGIIYEGMFVNDLKESEYFTKLVNDINIQIII